LGRVVCINLPGLFEEGPAGNNREHVPSFVLGLLGAGTDRVALGFSLTEEMALTDLSGVVPEGLRGQNLLGPGLGVGLGKILIYSSGGEGHRPKAV